MIELLLHVTDGKEQTTDAALHTRSHVWTRNLEKIAYVQTLQKIKATTMSSSVLVSVPLGIWLVSCRVKFKVLINLIHCYINHLCQGILNVFYGKSIAF